MNIYMKLLNFKMRSRIRIHDHIHTYGDLLVDIKNMGNELPNMEKTMHFLQSLTPSYLTLSKILFHCDNKTISYNKIVSILLTNEMKHYDVIIPAIHF